MELLNNEVLFRGEKYRLVDMEISLTHHELLECPFLIPVSDDNFILIEYPGETVKTAIQKYQEKGLRFFFIRDDHYLHFLQRIREKLQNDYNRTTKKKAANLVDDFEKYHVVVSQALSKIGIHPATIDMAKDMALYVVQVAQHNSNLFSMLHSFRTRCQQEYSKSLCVSYLISLMLEECSWSTKKIQQKVILASILADSTLKRQDFILFDPRMSVSPEDFSERVRNHPLEVASILRANGMEENETLTVIEEHHELPDGTGFPHKLTASVITQLSAVHIVARHFVEQIFSSEEEDFDLNKSFLQIYERFDKGNFKQSCASLFKLLGREKHFI